MSLKIKRKRTKLKPLRVKGYLKLFSSKKQQFGTIRLKLRI